jgi:hypothetical protein
MPYETHETIHARHSYTALHSKASEREATREHGQCAEVACQIGNHVGSQIGGQIGGQVGGQVDGQFGGQVDGQFGGQVGGNAYGATNRNGHSHQFEWNSLGRETLEWSAGFGACRGCARVQRACGDALERCTPASY